MKQSTTLTLILGLLFQSFLAAQVTINFDVSDPPWAYELNKEPAGITIELFTEAFKRAGIDARMKVVPWKRVLSGIDAGTCGAGAIYMNDERLKKYDYSAPYYVQRLVIYTPKGKEFPFEKIEDLYGKNIGVRRGYTYGTEFDAAVLAGKFIKIEEDHDISNLRKLSLGRLDAAISVWEVGEEGVKQLNLESSISRLPTLLSIKNVYLAFNKSANMKDTIAKFDQAMAEMKKDGTFNAIVKKGFETKTAQDNSSSIF